MPQAFPNLRRQILACRACEARFGFRPVPIMQGGPDAKIMQISQAPSQNVHRTKKVFTDASGKKLISQWYQISPKDFYNEKNFYITALAHCYPGKNPKGGDRQPPKICANKWLEQELDLVKTPLIILIGQRAANHFFPEDAFTKLIFKNQKISGQLTLILPHPSPLNQRWFKQHPDFLRRRLPQIRKIIH